MSNQVVFQIWSWDHNNNGSCEILFGHYNQKYPMGYTQTLLIYLCSFQSQYHFYYKYGTLTIRSFQRYAFCQDYKKIRFSKTEATKSQILCMFYILIYTHKRSDKSSDTNI